MQKLCQKKTSSTLCIPHICHKHHKRCLWRKNLSCGEILPCDRLSCGEGSPHDKMSLGKCLHIVNEEKNHVMWRNAEQNLLCGDISPHDKCANKSFCRYLCCFVAKSALLPFMLYLREINFVAIYALLCGEKFIEKLCLWRKKNKYEV